MLVIGSPCPAFEGLPGTDGKRWALSDFAAAKLLVVIVSCNHCPYVVAYEERIVQLSKRYAPQGVSLLAINANDVARYPADGLERMKQRAADRGFDFPYVRDDSQDVVRELGARFTPEVYVFDHPARRLRYHGRIDDDHRDASRVTSPDLATRSMRSSRGRILRSR